MITRLIEWVAIVVTVVCMLLAGFSQGHSQQGNPLDRIESALGGGQ